MCLALCLHARSCVLAREWLMRGWRGGVVSSPSAGKKAACAYMVGGLSRVKSFWLQRAVRSCSLLGKEGRGWQVCAREGDMPSNHIRASELGMPYRRRTLLVRAQQEWFALSILRVEACLLQLSGTWYNCCIAFLRCTIVPGRLLSFFNPPSFSFPPLMHFGGPTQHENG